MTSGVAGMCVQSFDAFLLEDGGWAIGDLLLTNPDAWFEVSPGMVGPDGDYGCLQFNPVTFGGSQGTPAGHAIVQLREFYNDPEFDNTMNSVNNPEYYAKATKAFEAATGIYDLTSSLVGDRPLNAQYKEAMSAVISNYLPQIISGERPIDDFDRMVEEWNAAGGLEVTAELQALLDK